MSSHDGGQQALDAEGLIAAWTVGEAPGTVSTQTARVVVAALLHELDAGGDGEQAWVDALHQAHPGLDLTVADVRRLRRILHDRLGGVAGSAESIGLRHQLDVLVDDLIAGVAMLHAERLEATARLDSLTGLYNRRAADEELQAALAHGERHGRPVAVAVIDLDGLKVVNDSGGHAAGDAVLRQLGDALRSNLRAGDTAYRIGGDEFLVIARDSEAADLAPMLERVRSVAPPFTAGVAVAPDDASDPSVLVGVADERLYAHRGLDRAVVPPPPRRRELSTVVLVAIASVVAELIRVAADIDLRPAELVVWRGLLVGAPLLAAALGGTRTPSLLTGGSLAGISLLSLLAALAPLVASQRLHDGGGARTTTTGMEQQVGSAGRVDVPFPPPGLGGSPPFPSPLTTEAPGPASSSTSATTTSPSTTSPSTTTPSTTTTSDPAVLSTGRAPASSAPPGPTTTAPASEPSSDEPSPDEPPPDAPPPDAIPQEREPADEQEPGDGRSVRRRTGPSRDSGDDPGPPPGRNDDRAGPHPTGDGGPRTMSSASGAGAAPPEGEPAGRPA